MLSLFSMLDFSIVLFPWPSASAPSLLLSLYDNVSNLAAMIVQIGPKYDIAYFSEHVQVTRVLCQIHTSITWFSLVACIPTPCLLFRLLFGRLKAHFVSASFAIIQASYVVPWLLSSGVSLYYKGLCKVFSKFKSSTHN